jgi:hypothetical protein
MYGGNRMPAKEKVYVAQKDGAAFKIYKYEDGEGAPSDDYEVDEDGKCSCPGYRYRKNCRHVRFLATLEEDADQECDEDGAAEIVKTVVSALGDVVMSHHEHIEFDPSDGLVAKITISCESREELDESLLMRGRIEGIPVEVTLS